MEAAPCLGVEAALCLGVEAAQASLCRESGPQPCTRPAAAVQLVPAATPVMAWLGAATPTCAGGNASYGLVRCGNANLRRRQRLAPAGDAVLPPALPRPAHRCHPSIPPDRPPLSPAPRRVKRGRVARAGLGRVPATPGPPP